MIIPLSSFATTSTTTTGQSCDLFVSWLSPSVVGNNQTIFGSQFFTNYYGVFTNNYNTDPVTQTAQMYTAQNALTTALLSSAPRSTGSDVFPDPVVPVVCNCHKGLIIGLTCAVGALFICVIVLVVLLVKKKKAAPARGEEIYGDNWELLAPAKGEKIYCANPSGELLTPEPQN